MIVLEAIGGIVIGLLIAWGLWSALNWIVNRERKD